MTPTLTVPELIDRGDLDELLRRIDVLCDEGDWAGLVDLRDRCRAAFARGRQLWPAASHAEYRVALQAPGPWAASVLGTGSGHFALGPLTEVVASTHTWAELAAHLPPTPEAAIVAHERVVRGEDLSDEPAVNREVLELPLRLAPWEPTYPLATYKPYAAEFPDEPVPVGRPEDVAVTGGSEVEDPDAVASLVELVASWTTQSNGRVRAVAVEGDAAAAIGTLTGHMTVRLTAVELAHALAVMAWAAASGGAHGRRRGMASGRFAAWWALAAVAGVLDDWPDLDDAVEHVRWYRWERPEPSTGWALRLAAEIPEEARAWAVEATDQG